MKRFTQILAALAIALTARAELVHVYQQTSTGAATSQFSDSILETGSSYTTQTAPAKNGYIFTHWSISTVQSFTNRDRWGRALDSVTYTLYEETTLTANYLPASQDTDSDGVADGHELYWYGGLQYTASSDTDNDGFTFAEELTLGTNPLFADEYPSGGIEYADSALLLYNPHCYQPYILRSEPAGALFASSTNWVVPGTAVTTPSYDHSSTIFGYWSMNGIRQADRWGRALDSVSFTMPSNSVEAVAYTARDNGTRQQMYWYGGSSYLPDSDTDNDGFIFAEELTLGTNPLFADEYPSGGIEYADSALLLYNPNNIQPYILRSEPVGALFASSTNWVRGGTTVSTSSFSPTSSNFAYWTLNGDEQRDRWGRALDSLSFAMPSHEVEVVAHTDGDYGTRMQLYWYGRPASGGLAYMPDSDTDNDGFTFAEELTLGTNPLFADEYPSGGIEYADSALLEANLQPYEQLTHGLVGGEAVEMFRSNWEKNQGAMNFGTNAAVAVVDANGDGLGDLLITGAGDGGAMQTTLLVNGGKTGSPDFTVGANPWPALNAALAAGCTLAGGLGPDGRNGVYISGEPIRFFDFTTGTFTDTALSGIPAWHDGVLYALDPVAGTVSTTNGVLSLDTPVIGGVSLAVADADHDGIADLLVTDAEGRVWFYKGNGEQGTGNGSFVLRHKVWGGSFNGFADGLRIAAIDWNADGNLDAIGATADGTLVLLRDPRVGTPANLRLAAGLTSVVLEWDPNTQSRVRGYRVYRGTGNGEQGTGNGGQGTGNSFEKIADTPLPTYRDYPAILRDWWYRVTSVGRFYTSGNSSPTFIESAPTEAQVAHLGGIELFVRDANGATGQEVEIAVAINNSLGMAAKDLSFTLEYDATLLEARRVVPSGLTEAVQFAQSAANGRWRVSATGGTVDPGAGTLFTLVFYVKPQHVADETTLTITEATAKSVSGQSATIPLPVSGTLSIFDTDPPIKPNVEVLTCVRSVVEREEVELPVIIVTDRPLDATTVRIEGTYDEGRLEGAPSMGLHQTGAWSIEGLTGTIPAGTNVLGVLAFTALDVASDMRTAVPVTNIAAVSTAGVAATPVMPEPFVVQVLNNPAYDPVHATFLPGTASAKIGTVAALPVSVQIDAALDGVAWSVSGTYDAALLDVLGATASASGMTLECAAANGAFTVSGTGGTLPAETAALELFSLRVKPKVQYSTRSTKVVFANAAATAADGRVFETAIGAGGGVAIRFASATDGPVITLDAFAGEVVERETISVPVRFTTSEALDRAQFAIEGAWDTNRLELVRAECAEGFAVATSAPLPCGAWCIEGAAGVVPEGAATAATLVFRSLDVAVNTNTLVHVTGGTAVSTEGIAGDVPAASYSILVKNNIAFDPAHAVFQPGTATARVGTATTLPVSVLIDAPLDGAAWSVSGTFDTALLDITGATAAAGLSVSFSKSGGEFTVRGTSGALAASPAAQPLFTLNVSAKTQYSKRVANIALRSPSAQTTDGRTFEASVANGGDIALRFNDSDEPPVVSFRSGALGVVERERVEVPIVLITTDTIDVSTLTVTGAYDAAKLELVEVESADGMRAMYAASPDSASPESELQQTGEWSLSGRTGFLFANSATTIATLVFKAKDVDADANAFVGVESASVDSADGIAAIVRKASPIVVTIHNNPAYDPVHATFLPGTASAKIGTEVALPVSVQIDAALDGAAWAVSGTYDAALLDVLGATASASGMTLECAAANGAFTVSGTGGTLPAATAAQPLFALRVRPKVQYETRTTAVSFTNATATAVDGRAFETAIGAGGGVAIHFSDTDEPPVISVVPTSAEGYERREISVPVLITTSDALDRGQLAIEGSWDTNRLELVRVECAAGMRAMYGASPDSAPSDSAPYMALHQTALHLTGEAGVVPAGMVTLGTLVFRAKDVVADTQTQVLVTGGTAVSTEGIAAAGIPSAAFVVTVKNDPAFDPIHATFAIGSGQAEIESIAAVKVSATFDQPMNGATLSMNIRYDASLLSVESVSPHVNGFTLSWSAASGILTITGKNGTIPVPSTKLDLLTINFRLAKQQQTHSTDFSFQSVGAKSTDGRTYIVDAATGGSVAITWTEKPRYFKGDVNGDGVLNGDDIRYMRNIIAGGSSPSADELKAGDFNGDGRITADDYALMLSYFRELGIPAR